jgi:sugar lactone lactonase YvrE
MKYDCLFVKTARITCFCLCFAAGISTASAQPADGELFKSSIFTPVNSFTSDVEGPAVDKDGNIYAVNFEKQGTIGKITPSGQGTVWITLPEGSIANGIRFDSRGNMMISDYAKHNVFRVEMSTRKLSTVVNEPRMHQPNDIAIDSKDRLYASDPDFKTRTGYVWRVDPNGKVTLLDSMGAANGIEVTPDERRLYVSAGRGVWAYDLSANGDVSNRRQLVTFPDFGVDGMRCDTAGNLYLARIGKGTVAEISPEGKIVREIVLTGKKPTNVAFGGGDGRTIYVTMMDGGNLESFMTDIPGREWKMNKQNSSKNK